MQMFRDMVKIERVINSCINRDHLDCAKNMIHNFNKKYSKENYEEHKKGKGSHTHKLGMLLTAKEVEILRINIKPPSPEMNTLLC